MWTKACNGSSAKKEEKEEEQKKAGTYTIAINAESAEIDRTFAPQPTDLFRSRDRGIGCNSHYWQRDNSFT